MKTKLLLGLGTLLFAASGFAGGYPLSGDYVATQSACPYLVDISGNGHPGSVINIVANAQSFNVYLKFICGAGDPCQPGEVALQTLTSENVGHFETSGEGGKVIFDGVYSNGGNQFLATVTDLGLPDQQGSPVSPEPQLEAIKYASGVRLVFDSTTVCDLALTQ